MICWVHQQTVSGELFGRLRLDSFDKYTNAFFWLLTTCSACMYHGDLSRSLMGKSQEMHDHVKCYKYVVMGPHARPCSTY